MSGSRPRIARNRRDGARGGTKGIVARDRVVGDITSSGVILPLSISRFGIRGSAAPRVVVAGKDVTMFCLRSCTN